MKSPPSSPRLHGAKMGPPPSPSRLKTLTENFHSLTGSNVHMVFAAAVSNNPEQIDVLSQLNPSEYTWEKLKEIKHSFAPVTLNHATTPEGVAALLDNLEFVQYWVGRCLVEDGVVPGTVWTHACMGPSIRTIEWLLENHGGTILVGLKTQDMEGAVDQVVPPTPLNEVLRQKKLLARAICYVLDSIDHAPKIYTMKGRDERASRAEKVIEMIRDHCYDLNRGLRVSGAAHGPKHVFSKTPLRHAALYGSIGCFDLILKSTNVVNPQSLFEALFPHFERNSFRDNNVSRS